MIHTNAFYLLIDLSASIGISIDKYKYIYFCIFFCIQRSHRKVPLVLYVYLKINAYRHINRYEITWWYRDTYALSHMYAPLSVGE